MRITIEPETDAERRNGTPGPVVIAKVYAFALTMRTEPDGRVGDAHRYTHVEAPSEGCYARLIADLAILNAVVGKLFNGCAGTD